MLMLYALWNGNTKYGENLHPEINDLGQSEVYECELILDICTAVYVGQLLKPRILYHGKGRDQNHVPNVLNSSQSLITRLRERLKTL